MENHESHTYPGEHPHQRADVRQQYRSLRRTPEQEAQEQTPEAQKAILKVRTVLNNVQQDTLFEIFREHYVKAGNNPDTLSLTPIANVDIEYRPEEDRDGGYSPYRKPLLNAARLASSSESSIVNALIHELVHEVSSSLVETITQEQSGDSTFTIERKSGVSLSVESASVNGSTNEIQEHPLHIVNDEINEGITQLLADDIHDAYGERVGGHSINAEGVHGRDGMDLLRYPIEKFNARLYIAFVSILAKVPEDVVKGALVRTYLRNGKLVPLEMVEALGGRAERAPAFVALLEESLNEEDFLLVCNHLAARLSDEDHEHWRKRVEVLMQQQQDDAMRIQQLVTAKKA